MKDVVDALRAFDKKERLAAAAVPTKLPSKNDA
jgi:hypothetical protein